jgi:type IV pilus assembly protein PilC
MKEFKYIGIQLSGQPIQGYFFAKSRFDAKKKIQELRVTNRLNVTKLLQKATFIYKIQRPNAAPIKGAHRAFTQLEVEKALNNMGFKILTIRKKLFEISGRVPIQDVVIFIRLCAEMLKEKFPYDEILQLLANDTENKKLKNTIKEIHRDLKMGKEGLAVYSRHIDVFGPFATTMLSIASTSGNMLEMYQSTAKYLERDFEFKKSLKSALFMPVIVLISVVLTFCFYLMYIFPKTTGLLMKYDIEVPPMTKASMIASQFLQANFIWLLLAFAIPVGALLYYIRTPKGQVVFHKTLLSIPVLGQLMHKSSLEIFSRVFNSLYSEAGENISVIKTASEACRNSYIEKRIKEIVIPIMLKQGRTLTECLEKTKVFPPNAINRFRAGEETGTIKSATLQLADYYEKEISFKMVRVLDWINLNISIVITLLIILITLISSEIGFVSPGDMMGKSQ